MTSSCGLRLRNRRISAISSGVCSFGWWCGLLDCVASDWMVPSQRLSQKYIYERALLYFLLARLTPYFLEYFIKDWRNFISCVILVMRGRLLFFWILLWWLYSIRFLPISLFFFLNFCPISIVALQKKILPASHGLLKNPDWYVIIMFMSIF